MPTRDNPVNMPPASPRAGAPPGLCTPDKSISAQVRKQVDGINALAQANPGDYVNSLVYCSEGEGLERKPLSSHKQLAVCRKMGSGTKPWRVYRIGSSSRTPMVDKLTTVELLAQYSSLYKGEPLPKECVCHPWT